MWYCVFHFLKSKRVLYATHETNGSRVGIPDYKMKDGNFDYSFNKLKVFADASVMRAFIEQNMFACAQISVNLEVVTPTLAEHVCFFVSCLLSIVFSWCSYILQNSWVIIQICQLASICICKSVWFERDGANWCLCDFTRLRRTRLLTMRTRTARFMVYANDVLKFVHVHEMCVQNTSGRRLYSRARFQFGELWSE
jgi:hypothetical protein